MFNSFGFVALVVFAAVLLTSFSLSATPEYTPHAEAFSLLHAHITPPAQPIEPIVRQ